MARIWKEAYDGTRHRNQMYPCIGINVKHYEARTLFPEEVYFVRVCSFTFEFHSLVQIKECLSFYSQKIHPSSRLNARGCDHWETLRWFERLPLYLQEEPKRVKVVTALEKAVKEFTAAKKIN
jgi:hypothetical protein